MDATQSSPSDTPFAVGDVVQIKPTMCTQPAELSHWAGHIGVVTKISLSEYRDWSMVWVSGCDRPWFEDELRSFESDLRRVEATLGRLEQIISEPIIDLR